MVCGCSHNTDQNKSPHAPILDYSNLFGFDHGITSLLFYHQILDNIIHKYKAAQHHCSSVKRGQVNAKHIWRAEDLLSASCHILTTVIVSLNLASDWWKTLPKLLIGGSDGPEQQSGTFATCLAAAV